MRSPERQACRARRCAARISSAARSRRPQPPRSERGRQLRLRPRRCGPSGSRSDGRSGRCSPHRPPRSPRRWSGSRPAAVEWKVDGIRVQVHRQGPTCGFSPGRWTTSPAGSPSSSRLRCRWTSAAAVLDGEAVALRPDGRPLPFQVTSARAASQPAAAARRHDQAAEVRGRVPLALFLFDLLHLDGADLIDAPGCRPVCPARRGGAAGAGHPAAGDRRGGRGRAVLRRGHRAAGTRAW